MFLVALRVDPFPNPTMLLVPKQIALLTASMSSKLLVEAGCATQILMPKGPGLVLLLHVLIGQKKSLHIHWHGSFMEVFEQI